MRLAAKILPLLLLLAAGRTAGANEDDARKARSLAARGQRAFDQGDYDAAMRSFQAAYDTKPHFLMQCNIARCHEMKGNYKQADEHYQRCLDEGADRSPMGGQVRSAQKAVRNKIPPHERDGGGGGGPPVFPPGSVPPRPFFAQGGMGAAVQLNHASTQIKLALIFGYHFNKTAGGPAIAGDIQFGVTNDFTTFELGPRFYWDIPVLLRGSTSLFVAPTGMLGFAHVTKYCLHGSALCVPARDGFTMQIGVEGRLVLAHRALIWFRPLSIDMMPTWADGDSNFGVRYDLMFGGGVIF